MGAVTGAVSMGVDLGQRSDPTAIAVVQKEWRQTEEGRREEHFLCRHIARLPLGTPYPQVAERVAQVAAGIVAQVNQHAKCYIDATGLGTPVLDVLKQARVKAELIGVYFTHGDRRTVVDGEIRLGKAWLVSRLQALLQGGQIHLPQTDESAALAKELLDYEIHVDEQANDRYGAFKTGAHDDLVTALGLAVQADPPADPLMGMIVSRGVSGWQPKPGW